MSIAIRDVREHELDSVLALNNAAGPAILPLDAARLRHLFDRAEYFRVAERDGARALADGLQAGSAQTVDGVGRHADGQARQQPGHTRHIAVVFAGLICTAKDNLIDRFGYAWVSVRQESQRQSRQVIGPYTR